jgi:L-ascorbate metabolism protein UlaG (beta-lactamase superfamily)
VILLATGGGRAGENPEAAAFAVRAYFKPRAIVPMHYGALGPPDRRLVVAEGARHLIAKERPETIVEEVVSLMASARE